MTPRLSTLLTLIFLLFAANYDEADAQRRRDINSMSPSEQLELRDLLMNYITSDIIQEHVDAMNIAHCYNGRFLTWHREYIADLEAWLMTQQNGSKYVPLPKWDPHNSLGIPGAFYAPAAIFVDDRWNTLSNQNISPFGHDFGSFLAPSVCPGFSSGNRMRGCGLGWSFGTALDNVAHALELQHNPVHVDIGGIMADERSPAAAIFFLWHAFIDDLYRYHQCHCGDGRPTDLYIKDNPADTAGEPNITVTDNVFWTSPDIWVRKNPDPIIGGRYQHQDDINRGENAEYKVTGDNYVYVRIRNAGCERVNAGTVRLRLYWTKASAGGLVWPVDWTTLPQGGEITTTPLFLPAIDPGGERVEQVAWHVPNPADYPTDPHHFCLVARLESAADPMAVAEGPSIMANTRNNNNIAWRNISVYDNDPLNLLSPDEIDWTTIWIRSPRIPPTLTSIRIDRTVRPGLRTELRLHKDLLALWERGGRKGTGFTRTQDPAVLILTAPRATLEGITLSDALFHRIAVRTSLRLDTLGGAPAVKYGEVLPVIITQIEHADNGEPEVVGGFTVEMRNVHSEATTGKPLIENGEIIHTSCPGAHDGAILLRMTDSSDRYTYWWSDGGSIRDRRELPVGTYTVYARNSRGIVDVRTFTVRSRSALRVDIRGGRRHGHSHQHRYTLTATVTGATGSFTVQWYLNGQAIPGGTELTLADVPAGRYMVEVHDRECSASADARITDPMMMMLDGAIATGDTIPDGKWAEAHAIGVSPFTYRWHREGWSRDSTTARITRLTPGLYYVTIRDRYGDSIVRSVVIGSTGDVESENGDDAALISSIIPNPAPDGAEIRFHLPHAGMVRIEAYDALGRMADLFTGPMEAGEGMVAIDTRGLASGVYTIRLSTGDVTSIGRLVVTR